MSPETHLSKCDGTVLIPLQDLLVGFQELVRPVKQVIKVKQALSLLSSS